MPRSESGDSRFPIHGAIQIALQIALIAFASYLVGFHVTGRFHAASASIGGLWAAIAGIVVLQATREETWSSAWLRILGTAIGSIISGCYLAAAPFSAAGMAACVFVTVLACHLVGVPGHARLAASTVAAIMVVSSIHPDVSPFANASLRFFEACVGTAMAVLVLLAWPVRKTLSGDAPAGPGNDAPRS